MLQFCKACRVCRALLSNTHLSVICSVCAGLACRMNWASFACGHPAYACLPMIWPDLFRSCIATLTKWPSVSCQPASSAATDAVQGILASLWGLRCSERQLGRLPYQPDLRVLKIDYRQEVQEMELDEESNMHSSGHRRHALALYTMKLPSLLHLSMGTWPFRSLNAQRLRALVCPHYQRAPEVCCSPCHM